MALCVGAGTAASGPCDKKCSLTQQQLVAFYQNDNKFSFDPCFVCKHPYSSHGGSAVAVAAPAANAGNAADSKSAVAADTKSNVASNTADAKSASTSGDDDDVSDHIIIGCGAFVGAVALVIRLLKLFKLVDADVVADVLFFAALCTFARRLRTKKGKKAVAYAIRRFRGTPAAAVTDPPGTIINISTAGLATAAPTGVEITPGPLPAGTELQPIKSAKSKKGRGGGHKHNH